MRHPKIQAIIYSAVNAPVWVWVLSGFLVSYLFFFVSPIFLSSPVMRFPKYVPALGNIGSDAKLMLQYSESLFAPPSNPRVNLLAFPPFTKIFFMPLLLFSDNTAYGVITILNIAAYALMTFVLPLRTSVKQHSQSLLMLILATGLLSYGFQFELERGQFNVIAVFFSILAVWIYHNHHRYRYWAYLLFAVSVQLKIYPFIFIVMFVSDWRDWKGNIKRWLGLSAANFALLFILGPKAFFALLERVKDRMQEPYIWFGNHSISSFVKIAPANGLTWLKPYSNQAQLALLGLVGISIFIVMLQAYLQNRKGLNPYLLLACTLGALLIPSESQDYTLAILAAPVAFLLLELSSLSDKFTQTGYRALFAAMVFIFSAAYSATLFSITNKPNILLHNSLTLIVILLVVACLSIIPKPEPDPGLPAQ